MPEFRDFALINPIYISLLYASGPLIAIALLPVDPSGTYPLSIVALISLTFLSAAIGWPLSVLMYLKKRFSNIKALESNKGFIFFYIMLFSLIFNLINITAGGAGMFGWAPLAGIKTVVDWVGLFSMVAFFWSVSAAIVDTQQNSNDRVIKVFVTFLQLFYLVIGVFFISKKIRSSCS